MDKLDAKDDVFHEILYLYENRIKTQEDIAEAMNSKYHTTLTRNLVGELTQQAGFHHTIKKTKLKRLFYVISPSFKKALESARYPGE
jgi:hypothetical protein